jgi:hypothetical protein
MGDSAAHPAGRLFNRYIGVGMEGFGYDPWPMGQHRYQAALFVIAAASGVDIRQAGSDARHRASKRTGCRSKTILDMLAKRFAKAEPTRVNSDEHNGSPQKRFPMLEAPRTDEGNFLPHRTS